MQVGNDQHTLLRPVERAGAIGDKLNTCDNERVVARRKMGCWLARSGGHALTGRNQRASLHAPTPGRKTGWTIGAPATTKIGGLTTLPRAPVRLRPRLTTPPTPRRRPTHGRSP